MEFDSPALLNIERSTLLHTTCPNSFCNYKLADLHETSTHVVIYCQNCGYEAQHERKNASSRPVTQPKLMVMPGGGQKQGKRKRKKRTPIIPLQRAG